MVLVGGHEIFFLCDYKEKTVGKKLRYNPFSFKCREVDIFLCESFGEEIHGFCEN